MVIKRWIFWGIIWAAFTIFSVGLFPSSGKGDLLYKNYVVREDRGREILCLPYVVKKDDWVYKLFRESGEISQKDYPEFLRIFTRMNPQINNLDIIRPGEHILIPLKKVQKDSMPGQSSGIVSVPFVNISNLSEKIKAESTEYEVKKGDYVSKIIAREYGGYGSQTYSEGMKLFKFLNPDVNNLNVIYPGQRLQLPSLALRDQPWYQYLFVGTGDLDSLKRVDGRVLPGKQQTETLLRPQQKKKAEHDAIAQVASILDGKFLNRGTYYFPREGADDAELDLSKHPVILLPDGSRVLFSKNRKPAGLDMQALQAYWKDISIAAVPADATVEQILETVVKTNPKIVLKEGFSFSDHNVEIDVKARWVINKTASTDKVKRYLCITFVDADAEMTPGAVVHYLEQRNITIWDIKRNKNKPQEAPALEGKKDAAEKPAGKAHKIFAPDRRQLFEKTFSAMGYRYKQDVSIPIAFSDVRKTVISNLLSNEAGREVVIDFAGLDDQALQAVEKAGYEILQPDKEIKMAHAIENLLRIMSETYRVKPVFFAARRVAYYNTRITIPGFLVERNKQAKLLITFEPLDEDLSDLLVRRGLQLVLIQER